MSWVVFAGIGWRDGQFDRMNEKMKKTNHDERRGSFSGCTCRASHTLGPPRISTSLIPPSSELEPSTSLWKGEDAAGLAFLSEFGMPELEPTSLKRGEGLISGLRPELEGEVGGEGEGGGSGMGR